MEHPRFRPVCIQNSLCFLGCLLFHSIHFCTMNPNREEVLFALALGMAAEKHSVPVEIKKTEANHNQAKAP